MLVHSVFCAVVVSLASTNFTEHFRNFILENYGNGTLELLERKELEPQVVGSFGGRRFSNETIDKRPVVFVHGALLTAGLYTTHVEYFMQHGYKLAELYATTLKSFFVPFFDAEISCEKTKQIRKLIEVVHKYTNSMVDVISWSLGTPITRKAILGGRCFDTGEYIGNQLTSLKTKTAVTNTALYGDQTSDDRIKMIAKVDTYIAVGGIVHGLRDCPQHRIACSGNNSIHCSSELMEELNSQNSRYEANYTYGLFALNDEILAHCCEQMCGALPNAIFSLGLSDYDHVSILRDTPDVQFGLLAHPTLKAFRVISNSSPLNQTTLQTAKFIGLRPTANGRHKN